MPLACQQTTQTSRWLRTLRGQAARHQRGPAPGPPLRTRPKAPPAPSAKPACERPPPLPPCLRASRGSGPALAAGGGDNGAKPHQRGGERRRPGCRSRSAAHTRTTRPEPGNGGPHLPTQQRRHGAEAAPARGRRKRRSQEAALPPPGSGAPAPRVRRFRPPPASAGAREAVPPGPPLRLRPASLLRAHSAPLPAFRSSRLAHQMHSPFPTRSPSTEKL